MLEGGGSDQAGIRRVAESRGSVYIDLGCLSLFLICAWMTCPSVTYMEGHRKVPAILMYSYVPNLLAGSDCLFSAELRSSIP